MFRLKYKKSSSDEIIETKKKTYCSVSPPQATKCLYRKQYVISCTEKKLQTEDNSRQRVKTVTVRTSAQTRDYTL